VQQFGRWRRGCGGQIFPELDANGAVLDKALQPVQAELNKVAALDAAPSPSTRWWQSDPARRDENRSMDSMAAWPTCMVMFTIFSTPHASMMRSTSCGDCESRWV